MPDDLGAVGTPGGTCRGHIPGERPVCRARKARVPGVAGGARDSSSEVWE